MWLGTLTTLLAEAWLAWGKKDAMWSRLGPRVSHPRLQNKAPVCPAPGDR